MTETWEITGQRGFAQELFMFACTGGRDGRKMNEVDHSRDWERDMAGAIEQKLASLGITLHEAPAPVANYVGFVRAGNLLFVSGQVCFDRTGMLIAKGKLGTGVSIEQGAAAARGCAINLLAQIKAALGDLDKVVRVVRLGGFIHSAPDFVDWPQVVNGASDLMVQVFGDKGRHARTTVGVASLPADAAVEG